ncbi:tRNA pseudouridine(55) synthase TruB [Moraxella oblonga]|uniref:tRNA pseudouridine(55) synthase TruB n=1 Tax=Moraxella oblonga TaxID=200413 RepID=UPI000832D178|nr:tRNA pseudouridine(55) synthase TruB [Moraxella oblonga]
MAKKIVSGVLLLDKPNGISSHTALNQAKRLFMSPQFDSKKAGHTGTLDPMATGLLPICLGEATKFSSFGLDADKGYHAVIRLGEQTDTGDKEGEVAKILPTPTFTQDDLNDIAQTFTGEQQQIPPMYSALKKDGKKLYEYAREGIDVERQARPIVIHWLTLTKIDEQHIALHVICSKGTYVRVLGEDIAKKLGTVGHLTALHRTKTGGFDVMDSVNLDELTKLDFDERFAKLLPIDALLVHLPMLDLSADETARIKMGQRLNVKDRTCDLVYDEGCCQVRLYHEGVFFGLGQVERNGRLQPVRLVS